MSEVSAALGLLQLEHIGAALDRRAQVDVTYRAELAGIEGIRCVEFHGASAQNYAYFPILVDDSYPLDRDGLYRAMRARGIYTRRYFYPLISEFPMYRGLPSAHRDNLPVAHEIARRVLCLPIYPALDLADQQRVIEIVRAGAA